MPSRNFCFIKLNPHLKAADFYLPINHLASSVNIRNTERKGVDKNPKKTLKS